MILLVPLSGLLPVSWFGGPAPWRSMLAESWGIYLPATLSPDPHATFESWLVMAAGAVWLWACLGQRASEEGRRWCIYGLAIGGALIAGASLIDYSWAAIPWWPREGIYRAEGFGPFFNRNHASSLSAISAILCAASAYDAYRRKSSLAWLFLLLFWLPLCTIFLNTSRGGVGLLFLGLVAWVTTAAMKKGLFRKMAVGAAVLMVVASVALVSSGRLGSRLRDLVQEDGGSLLSSSMRMDLARETLSLSAKSPFWGQGLDTFYQVFPLISDLKFPHFRFLHPESDLLLVLFEGGLFLLMPCLVLLLWAASSSGSWTSHPGREEMSDRPGRRLRQAAAIGAGMALLHSVFDVPNHGLGYGMQTALLLGLAVRPRCLSVPARWLQPWAFRLAGLLIFGMGIMWLGTGLHHWMPPLPTSVQVLREQIRTESAKGRYRDCLTLVNRAIHLAPLDYRLYYMRAQMLLLLRQNPERALLDFGRSRTLEPHYAKTCFEEGVYWLPFAPDLAIIPWRECLRRHKPGSSQLRDVYASMLSKTGLYPELRPPLWALAETPEMQLVFLMNTSQGREWEEYLGKFLKLHPKLEVLGPKELQTLLRAWHDRGDREALVSLLQKNHSLQPYGWRTMAVELARAGRYEQAYFVANKFIKKPLRPSRSQDVANLARLERAFVFNPTDVRPGIELYLAYRASGDVDSAKSTAEKVVALPDVPVYMKLELAALYAEISDFRRAWEMMEHAMHSLPDV
ncbi:O-antigen ligase family protein [Prosthecobacter sp. SYSU 5D2]|uniref:O-antigen ligase family protein n=1 Tax=Prosthecobacter sp. SYSU 5D2 TaxID=3134134 RepID=UPI0031FE4FAA